MSEWVLTPLGDVTSQVRDVVKMAPGRSYDLLGLRMYGGGVYLRETVTAETSKASHLYRASAGQFVYNRMFAWGGAFGVVPNELDGSFVSNEFPLFDADPGRLLVDYLRLYFQQPAVWERIDSASSGTTKSRNRWKESLFRAHMIALPPLPEQRRIVDIMAAVDEQVAALEVEQAGARRLLKTALTKAFAETSGHSATIVDLCEHIVGGIWGSPEGHGEVDRLALGPRIYSRGTTDFITDGSPIRSLSAKQAASRTVQEGDIILERSGGSTEQPVGRVVIAGPGLQPCVPTDFQRLLRADSKQVLPKFLFWRLHHDWADGLTRNYSRRTTGIMNLSVKDYLARAIDVPPFPIQAAIVETADAIDARLRATIAELATLRVFRSTLLTSCLNQAVEIPESYDAILEPRP